MRSKFAALFMACFLLSPAVIFASAKNSASPVMATSSSHPKKGHHSKKHSKTKKTKPAKKA